MVKIIGRSAKENTKKERESKLIKIAKEVFGEEFKILNTLDCIINLQEPDSPFNIPISVILFTTENKISVNDPEYLDSAIKLAKAYESSGEPEFIVKKDYYEASQ